RYPTKELLVQCLQKLWESAGADGEGERCSKLFIGKPSGSTAGVEGLFTGDGVMVAHVFQITAESPADAVDMLVHLLVQPCLVITDIPCMLAPIAGNNHPDLLDEGGALPRNDEGQIFLKGLQHIRARARDFPDLHSVKVPPGGFPSTTASSALGAPPVHNVYAIYAAAEPSPGVPAQLDFRTLLGHHADMVEKDRQVRAAPDAESDVTGVNDWSSSPKRISELSENTLNSLHNQGWYAIDLFEVVLVFSLWFQAAGRESAAGEAQGAGGERRGGADETPPERETADLSTKELLDISGHLMETLRVAIGSTDVAGLTMMCMPEFLGDDVLYYSQSMEGVTGGAVDDIQEGVVEAPPVLRNLEDAVNLHHQTVTFIIDSLDAVDNYSSERA
ncbi:unnamed protein product, partial [Ectocarpus sp. 4 AP-2014]